GVMALGGMGADARAALPALVLALQDPCPLVRRWAAASLGEIGSPAAAAIPALIEALDEDDVKNRAVAAATLGKIGSRVIPRLIDALNHVSPRVRRHAATTLGKIGKPQTTAPILRLHADDPDEAVRDAIFEALLRVGNVMSSAPPAE